MKETIEQVTEQAHDAAIATRVQIDEAREALKRRMRRGVGRRQGGAALVEYALLVGLIAVAVIAGLTAVAGALWGGDDGEGVFNTIIDELGGLGSDD
ncbi:Flp family type IVb pilin [Halorhodospira sp. 9622]|uniref:Flp family type IVb pilin n=1 Tax=Halorhodospira sp. 9622 TaxID=2899136 RepID=UPI001EE83F33|nr:hypothetical protein [Halorhodospira sp. 9622]MCG5538630.1 hypothetical protein [Halorhodospira sp. 9622]